MEGLLHPYHNLCWILFCIYRHVKYIHEYMCVWYIYMERKKRRWCLHADSAIFNQELLKLYVCNIVSPRVFYSSTGWDFSFFWAFRKILENKDKREFSSKSFTSWEFNCEVANHGLIFHRLLFQGYKLFNAFIFINNSHHITRMDY